MPTTPKTLRSGLILVPVVLGLVWLFVGLWLRPVGDYGVETDFYGDLAVHARTWMSGHPTVATGYRGPVYYVLLAGAGRVFGDLFLAAKVISAVAAALSLLVAGRLLARLWDPVVGLAAQLALAASAVFALYTFRACTDMVYLAVFLGALSLLLATGARARDWVLAGLLAGVAMLTRDNGVALVPVCVAIAAITVRPWRTATRRVGVFLLAWLVPVVPWVAYVAHATGHLTWSRSFQNVAIAVYASDPGVAANGGFAARIGFASLREVVQADPSLFWTTMARHLVGHLQGDARSLMSWPWSVAGLLGALGALVAHRRGQRVTTRQVAFGVSAVLVYLSLVPVFYNPRFMLPLAVFWATGVGLVVKVLGRHTLQIAAVVILTGLAVRTQVAVIERSTAPSSDLSCPTDILAIADQARQSGYRFGPDTPIAARKPHIGYYLGAPVVPIRGAGEGQPMQPDATYLLVTGAEVRWRPQLAGLMFGQQVPPGWEVVARALTAQDDSLYSGGTLYRLPTPAIPDSATAPPSIIPGLDRLETLRLKVARWSLHEDGGFVTAPLLARIPARHHPAVLTLAGDRAFYAGDLAAAASCYREALPDSGAADGSHPAFAENHLRLVAVASLRSDWRAMGQDLARYVRLAGMKLPWDQVEFWGTYDRLLAAEDDVAALGLLLGAQAITPGSPTLNRAVERLLRTTGWADRARQ